jgi:hypothetical protein
VLFINLIGLNKNVEALKDHRMQKNQQFLAGQKT